MPYPDDEICSLRKRVLELEGEVRRLSAVKSCEDCGADVPVGRGIGFSVPVEEWTDRSKSRPMHIIPLCTGCTVKRILKKEE